MSTPLPVTEYALQQLQNDVAFTRQYGFRLHAIADGTCTLYIPFQPLFERPGEIIGGQVFMAAADVAMWLAIMTRLGIEDQSVTSDINTAFLRSVQREDFQCTATILKLGRRLIYDVAECVDTHHQRLTHHTITYIRPVTTASHKLL